MGKPDLTDEELKGLLEEQKKKVEAMLAAMTPEQRADAAGKLGEYRQAHGAEQNVGQHGEKAAPPAQQEQDEEHRERLQRKGHGGGNADPAANGDQRRAHGPAGQRLRPDAGRNSNTHKNTPCNKRMFRMYN